ncbi:MAG: helix-turn-helix domain-containing protein [Gammaproteobacteria bacterium]|nr:helix-turn-helix domain-containing protein [Gammaproteobacteria bacterium]
MATLKALGNRLKELRDKHDLTQEEFGAIAGFSQKHYQQIESGNKKQIWLETVERLAAAYGLEAWQILAPTFPSKTKLAKKPKSSKIHNKKLKPTRKKRTRLS